MADFFVALSTIARSAWAEEHYPAFVRQEWYVLVVWDGFFWVQNVRAGV